MQRACYSGHKRFYLLIYQTLKAPDGLLFPIYGLDVGKRHYMTLHRQRGLYLELRDHFAINSNTTYMAMLRTLCELIFKSYFYSRFYVVQRHVGDFNPVRSIKIYTENPSK